MAAGHRPATSSDNHKRNIGGHGQSGRYSPAVDCADAQPYPALGPPDLLHPVADRPTDNPAAV